MANMNLQDSWDHRLSLLEHLARELLRGRLALLLGAGVSTFYGLPEWVDLVNRICRACHESEVNNGENLLLKVQAIRGRHFKGNDAGFLEVVREALYQDVSLDFEKIRKNDTLAAIGSLVMASQRGSASQVVTFNYDDLLELFLEYHGFVTRSVFDGVHWAGNQDVTIYHPHGFLPLGNGPSRSKDIVLGVEGYLDIMETASQNLWRPLLQTLLRTHTVIYVGLSGNDIHLQSLVKPLRDQHAITIDRFAYHGVRFAVRGKENKDLKDVMASWGLYTQVIDSYNELPSFLFGICQAARRMRVTMVS